MNYGFFAPIFRVLEIAFLSIAFYTLRLLGALHLHHGHWISRVEWAFHIHARRYAIKEKKMREILSDHVQTNKLSRSEYLKEMSNSKICASPFGLGEITLKYFECFLSGSLLLKPDMSHMDTWPNFYVDGETCITHNWDLHDVEEKIIWALSQEQNRIEIAQQGQKRYLEYTCKQGAAARFAKHFESIILSET
jgi:hypothetical protein